MKQPTNIVRFAAHSPVLDASAWVAPTAMLVGDVVLGADASVFYGAVLRADQDRITIGAGSNLQDLVVAHADPGFPVTVGSGVSVGHRAILHGCTVEDHCLIGMGAVILNGAVIGECSLIAAGALILGGARIPPRSLVTGSPGRVRRDMTDTEVAANHANAERYKLSAQQHRLAWATS